MFKVSFVDFWFKNNEGERRYIHQNTLHFDLNYLVCDCLGVQKQFLQIVPYSFKCTPDLIFVSNFNKQTPFIHKNVPHVFIQFENDSQCVVPRASPCRLMRKNHLQFPQVGYVETNFEKLSHSFYRWESQFNGLKSPRQSENRQKTACSMFNQMYPHREAIIKKVGAYRIKHRDKIEALSNYAYNIAVENSYQPFYITEKCNDALLAGCIPIYQGGDLKQFTPYNLDKIIFADDINNFDNLSKSLLKKLSLSNLRPNADEMYNIQKKSLTKFLTFVMSNWHLLKRRYTHQQTY